MKVKNYTYRLVCCAVVAIIFSFTFSGCIYECWGDMKSDDYGPKDLYITTNDTSARITSLCYPQVNNKCLAIHRSYSSYTYSNNYDARGLLLRGFNETIVELHLSNGQIETLHYTYKLVPVQTDCDGLIVEFQNLQLISTTLDSFYFNNTSYQNYIIIQKY